MSVSTPSPIRFCLALTLGALVAFGPSQSLAQSKSSDKLPTLEPLGSKEVSPRQAHQQVLNSLYDQLQKTESEEAAKLIVAAVEKLWERSGSDTADLLMERAGTALKARNYSLATKLLSAVTQIEPRYVAGWSQLATVHFMQNDYVEAMSKLQQVLALDPRHFKAIEGLSIILRETGQKRAALQVVRRALEIHPHLESAKQAERELEREVKGQAI